MSDDKTNLERVAGNLGTGLAATAAGTLGATVTPLAAFVPFLVSSLASKRHAERLEKRLTQIEEHLQEHDVAVENFTDDQYKIVNEAVGTAFYTIDEQKLDYLVEVIRNSSADPAVSEGFSDALSRIARDISAEEALFVLNHFSYEGITVSNMAPTDNRLLRIRPGSKEEVIISGLINIGVFYVKDSQWDSAVYSWSPLVSKLVKLLGGRDGQCVPS